MTGAIPPELADLFPVSIPQALGLSSLDAGVQLDAPVSAITMLPALVLEV